MRSIHSKLALYLLLGFLVLLTSAAAGIFLVGRSLLEKDFNSRLFAKAQAALASISQKSTVLDVDWNELPHRQKQLGEEDVVQVTDFRGTQLVTDDSEFPPLFSPTLTDGYHDVAVVHHGQYRILVLSFTPRIEEEDAAVTPTSLLKPCVLFVGTSRHDLDHSLRSFGLILVGTTLLTLMVSSIMVYKFVSIGLEPLDRFSTFVGTLGINSLGQRISKEGLPTEIQPIAERLNTFLETLDLSFTRERQFSSDVSHELRTPVAELRTLAEVMLRSDELLNPESKQGFEEALEISKRMGSLIGILLEIVRQERSTDVLILKETDPCRLLEKQWSSVEGKAKARQLCFRSEATAQGLMIATEPSLLEVILGNLLDNAVEYAVPGSAIEAKLLRKGDALTLVIGNRTADLAPDDLPYIFNRFWRKDSARGTSSHFGIGLAITRTLCQRLGIELSATIPKASWVEFQLRFPTSEIESLTRDNYAR